MREALFSALQSLTELPGARVLDLYAGSGALGLEALSRGAAHATLVEAAPSAVRVLRRNVAALGLPGADVRPVAVRAALVTPPPQPYDIVLADPPYGLPDDQLAGVLAALAAPGWLAPAAVLVVERASRCSEPRWPAPLTRLLWRRYGDTALCYGAAP